MFDASQRAFQQLGQIVASNVRPLVAWVGAGLSRPAGLPTWTGLRKRLTETLEEKVKALDPAEKNPTGKLQAAREHDNFWIAFRLLREGIGEATYHATIREALETAPRAELPPIYTALWRLRLSGLLNLNLDRLASRAFAGVHGTRSVTEFPGRDARSYAHVLRNPTSPFIANLHGTAEDANSWVFTDEDLKRLTELPGYREFINACAMTRTILFVGISADDVAAGGYLARLRGQEIDFGEHFWITDRRDGKTDEWAEHAGVRVIRYDNTDGLHRGLEECIDALLKLLPEEELAGPIVPARPTGDAPNQPLLPPEELVQVRDPEAIRRALNAEAARILADESEAGYLKYEAFCQAYDEAIHRAWYVPRELQVGRSALVGYQLVHSIAAGGFGTVYEAATPAGEPVAIKLLHEAIRNDPEHLQSFRRGVRSMRLLTEAGVAGVVRYHAAVEIPALAVMDFVPGPTLHEKVQQLGSALTWSMTLRIGAELARILRSSHQLPQRVLHRDFRPKNIMFRENWDGDEEWEIVVLDFDLSWHKDSQEKSVTLESYSGYLAPEQVEKSSKYSTRSALVDSYGLGMTLYYLRTRQEPTFAQPARTEWDDTLQACSERTRCKEWVSLPRRYFRLVANCTRVEQPRRWDITQIESELTRLGEAMATPVDVQAAELLAEEVAARAFPDTYRWDPDTLSAVHQLTDEAKILVTGNESAHEVELTATWTDNGTHHFAETRRWGLDAIAKARAALEKTGWVVRVQHVANTGITLKADIPVEELAPILSAAAGAVGKVNEAFIRQ